MKLNYSEPKIYTGGVDISIWSKLKSDDKKLALSKDWFVYFSFRDPQTGKLKKQPFIKAGVNKLKTKRERYAFLKTMQKALSELLQYGFNPYQDNSDLEQSLFYEKSQKEQNKSEVIITETKSSEKNSIETADAEEVSIEDAFKLALELKEQMMNRNSFVQYKSRINLFTKWLKKEKKYNSSIDVITKKLLIQYLNDILKRTSPRNRNNSRTDIASLFQVLEDNEIIQDNFVRKIPVLKSVPKRNKTYTPTLEKDIYTYLEQNDTQLLLFIKFISYNFLRPIEVCRLRIEDIDINDRKLYVKAKNQPVKIKIIPEILINDLPNLSSENPKDFLFTKEGLIGQWNIEGTNKRNVFSKKFKKIKDHFELGKEFGLYSFRHTFITKLYRKLRESMSQFEAKSNLMLITGHATMSALELYLRDIDAELPEDYSGYLK